MQWFVEPDMRSFFLNDLFSFVVQTTFFFCSLGLNCAESFPKVSLGTGLVNNMAATACWPLAKIGLKSNFSGGSVCV